MIPRESRIASDPPSIRFLTVFQVARMLAVSKSLVYELAAAGKLASYKIGKNAIRFHPDDVAQYLRGCRTKVRRSKPAASPGTIFKHLDAARLAKAWREQGVS